MTIISTIEDVNKINVSGMKFALSLIGTVITIVGLAIGGGYTVLSTTRSEIKEINDSTKKDFIAQIQASTNSLVEKLDLIKESQADFNKMVINKFHELDSGMKEIDKAQVTHSKEDAHMGARIKFGYIETEMKEMNQNVKEIKELMIQSGSKGIVP
jgi:hypothetical protein